MYIIYIQAEHGQCIITCGVAYEYSEFRSACLCPIVLDKPIKQSEPMNAHVQKCDSLTSSCLNVTLLDW